MTGKGYIYPMVHHLAANNSILNTWIAELRDIRVQHDRMRFRRNMERVGEVLAYEISKGLHYQTREVETPMGMYTSAGLPDPPVLATILRAGLPLFQGLLNYFDRADCAFIAAYRKHSRSDDSFEINQGYVTCPSLQNRILIIADPMLATGSSLITALEELQDYGQATEVHIAVAIACTEGIEAVHRRFPDYQIWAADIDEELTAKGYIVPGLGDAGDLSFGPKLQE